MNKPPTLTKHASHSHTSQLKTDLKSLKMTHLIWNTHQMKENLIQIPVEPFISCGRPVLPRIGEIKISNKENLVFIRLLYWIYEQTSDFEHSCFSNFSAQNWSKIFENDQFELKHTWKWKKIWCRFQWNPSYLAED